VGAAAEESADRIETDAEDVPFAPRRARLDLVSAGRERRAGRLGDAILDPQNPRARPVRVEARGEVRGREARRLDRLLQVHAEFDQVQKELQGPLILLIAPRRAEGEK